MTEKPDWLMDGGEPGETEREIAESLASARWSPDEADLERRLDTSPERKRGGHLHAFINAPLWRKGLLAAAAVAVVAVGWAVFGGAPAAWNSDTGAWRPGEWLNTAQGPVEVRSDIGRVTIAGKSRVRLKRAGDDEHRIELVRGTIDAFIVAPPELFFVETPLATAVDMGCAYTLVIGDDGAGSLIVTSGWVELRGDSGFTRVPAGAMANVIADGTLGLPRFEDATDEFAALVDRYDAGEPDALGDLLEGARARDTLSVWHLISRTDGDARSRVIERLNELAPPRDPETATLAASLDERALDQWWWDVRLAW